MTCSKSYDLLTYFLVGHVQNLVELHTAPVDLDESVLKGLDNQPLPVHVSVLDHLQVRSGLVVDAQPFLDSLRRVYHEQLARSV